MTAHPSYCTGTVPKNTDAGLPVLSACRGAHKHLSYTATERRAPGSLAPIFHSRQSFLHSDCFRDNARMEGLPSPGPNGEGSGERTFIQAMVSDAYVPNFTLLGLTARGEGGGGVACTALVCVARRVF